jgi:glycyl-tRNA synthetase beta chain
MVESKDFLFELGTEELPPKSLTNLSAALEANLIQECEKAGLSYAAITSFATPRRLALWVSDLASRQPDQTVERRGPSLGAAYDMHGRPTQATEGFARSCGVNVEDLIVLRSDKGEWVGIRQHLPGCPTEELLPDMLLRSLTALPIAKRMRWGSGEAEFVRPVHWLVVLYGNRVVPCRLFGLDSGRTTRGHRFHAPGSLVIQCPETYESQLANEGRVLARFATRREKIERLARETAAQVRGVPLIDADLLDEVTALVEWPVPVLGEFDPRYLALPPEVLIHTMQEHQRYFPVVDSQNRLLAHFITFSNLESRNPEAVQRGNERVIRPRLADAEFFWNQDRRKTLEERVEGLRQIMFQKTLGSLLDKTRRVQSLAMHLAESLELETSFAERAALLAKADLLTEMVGEFPNLQGVMGRYYALAEGEPEEIAAAIEEQYLPRVSGGPLPMTRTGQILAVSEKIDTLAGIFSIGSVPTGDKDPYGLRRAALGVVRILIEKDLDVNLADLLDRALRQFHHRFDRFEIRAAVLDFVFERLRGYSLENGFRHDEYEAVSAVKPTSLVDFQRRMVAVREFRRLTAAASLAAANKRIRNILRKSGETVSPHADERVLVEEAEKVLLSAVRQAHADILPLLHGHDYTAVLCRLSRLRETVDAFFDQVLVLTEDPTLRANRLGLLAMVEKLFLHVADISNLQPVT